MAMTAVRWSSFVECMERVLRWPCTNSAYVCIALCALELEWRVYWRSMQYYEVIISASYAISLSTYTTITTMMALCSSWFVERMERVSCCPWTNRPYVRIAVCVCSNLKVLLVFDAVCGRNVTLIIYTHYNGNDGSALIFVCWMYGTTGVVLALNQQYVSLYCCVCLNLKVLVISVWCSMRS